MMKNKQFKCIVPYLFNFKAAFKKHIYIYKGGDLFQQNTQTLFLLLHINVKNCAERFCGDYLNGLHVAVTAPLKIAMSHTKTCV